METAARKPQHSVAVFDGTDDPGTVPFQAASQTPQLEGSMAASRDHTPEIFAVSAGLMGVSLSGIGLFAIVSQIRAVETVGEELLAFNACIFAISCAFAFFCMKANVSGRKRLFQLSSEAAFLFGLVLMASACVFLATSIR